ncbi:MAG TPA: TetR family transcriptional regulator, partial [Trebonia sp.]
ETGPETAPALELVGAALDTAAAFFEEVREFVGLRHRIVASSRELQERELAKYAALATALAQALRARGFDDTAAALAARSGMTVMQVALERWVDSPGQAPFQQVVRAALARLREMAAAG